MNPYHWVWDRRIGWGADMSRAEPEMIRRFMPNFTPIPDQIAVKIRPVSFTQPDEINRKRTELAREIFKSHTQIRMILDRHEGTIQKRWLKKTCAKRRRILLDAWPNMTALHAPNIQHKLQENGTEPSSDAFKWPHINLEDLTTPKLLLIFLNARGRSPPSSFVGADSDSCVLGFLRGKVPRACLDNHTMMFIGRDNVEEYGELLGWKDHPNAFEWFRSRRGMPPGEGLCPEPPTLSTSEPGVGSLAATVAEAPYRVPSRLDLARLSNIMEAKRAAAEDHIWGLREDPGYFAHVALELNEHRSEHIPDINGEKHPDLKTPPFRRFWDTIITDLVIFAYAELTIWDDVHSRINRLRFLLEKHAAELIPKEPLPAELLKEFLQLLHNIQWYMRIPTNNLTRNVTASPPMRPWFMRLPAGAHCEIMEAVASNGKPVTKTMFRFHKIVKGILEERGAHLDTLLDELERTIQNDRHARNLCTPPVRSSLSDWSALITCEQQLLSFEPWTSTFPEELDKCHGELERSYWERMSFAPQLSKYLESKSLARLGDPSDHRFRYPIDKRRTSDTTATLQASENGLDCFWQRVDSLIVGGKFPLPDVLTKLLQSDRILHRTPDWVEPSQAKPEGSLCDMTQPLSDIYYDLQQRTEKTIVVCKKSFPKLKVKTRGIGREVSDSSDSDDIHEPSHQNDPQPTFHVDKRALKVFTTLFYQPSYNSQPGEVPWNDFLHAMKSTGFASEKLYGSVWNFTPFSLDVDSAIQFHEPHPIAKIPFWTARRMGRRLSRAYGWRGDMFFLQGD